MHGDGHYTPEVSKWREAGMADIRYMGNRIAMVTRRIALAEIGTSLKIRSGPWIVTLKLRISST